jgi:hypothetical protein
MAKQPRKRRLVGGVDTHKDIHHAAVVLMNGRRLADAQFPATAAGNAAPGASPIRWTPTPPLRRYCRAALTWCPKPAMASPNRCALHLVRVGAIKARTASGVPVPRVPSVAPGPAPLG